MDLQVAIEKLWYSRNPLCWLVWPFHCVFYLVVQLKRGFYLAGITACQKFDKPVILVGNINVGGTGKTPFIRLLVNHLKSRKLKVGIVSRGYQAKINRFPHQVGGSDTALTVGDEAFMQYSELEVPIVIDPNRSQAVKHLLNNNTVDVVISDDGLQHYKMGRDLEIVLFDGQRQFGNQLIMPFGPLREPVSRLKTTDLVIQNGTQDNPYTEYQAALIPVSLINLSSKLETPINGINHLIEGRHVNAVAGIGNPMRFFTTLRNILLTDEAEVSEQGNRNAKSLFSENTFPDHHAFTADDFVGFDDEFVVMTEKDAVKC
jgi:tetraacyldisaccharide 4'-kinase